MRITESSRLYLNNYYILEEARHEAHRFLEDIAIRFSEIVEEHINRQNSELIQFKKYVQKDGGHVQFYNNTTKPVAPLEQYGEWKYTLEYFDAMRASDLSSSTKCIVYASTPQNKNRQMIELQRMANMLKMPNPYEKTEIELVDKPVEDVINQLAKEFIDRYDNLIRLLEALIEESKQPAPKDNPTQ